MKSSNRQVCKMLSMVACLAGFLLTLAGCEDEPVQRDYPRVKTLEVTNITSEGALFVADIYEPGDGEISEHGFVWALSRPGLEYDNKIMLGSLTGTGEFTAEVRSTLSEGLIYQVAAFVRSGEYTVYGNTVEFMSMGSMGPEITGFTPDRVLSGDTILIRGKRFSWVKGLNQVIFNETVADICSPVTDTTILVVVPFSLTVPEQTLSVEVAGNRTTFSGSKLMVDLPTLDEISPASAHWGDTVEITIKNLRPQNQLNIQFGSVVLLPVVPFDGQTVSFVVPWTVSSSENQLKIMVPGGEFTSPSPFILLPPVIDSISPSHGVWSDEILLFGSFNKSKENTAVRFGQYNANIVYVSRDTIMVTVPDNLDISLADVVYSFSDLSSAPVPFSLKPPEIISVSPMNGPTGTNVRIDCKNLKYPFVSVWLNDVEIGWTALGGYSYDDTFLYCYIKGSFNGPAYFRVTVCGQSDTWDQPFMVENPYIVSFSPQTAIPGDTITIVAENFVDYQSYFNILEGTYCNMPVLSRNGNVFRAEYPDCDQISGPIYATSYVNSQESRIPSADYLTQSPPVISSVTPLAARYLDEIIVRGENFSNVREYNHLSVNGVEVELTSFSRDELRFRMPLLPAGDYPVELRLGGYSLNAGQQLTCLSAWERLPDLPFTSRESFVMNFNGDIIVAAAPEWQSTVFDRNLYRFNPETENFTQTGNQISCIATYFGLVVKGDKAYISRFNSTLPPVLDVFDKNTLTLSKVSDLPVSGGDNYWLMDGDSVLLAGLGNTYWKYNLLSGRWTRLRDLPAETNKGHVFTIGGRNFIITSRNEIYEYNAISDTWTQKNQPSLTGYCWNSKTVVYNNKAYICSGYAGATEVNVYDPLTDTWEKEEDAPFYNHWELLVVFFVGDTLYMEGGESIFNFWSFDTSL